MISVFCISASAYEFIESDGSVNVDRIIEDDFYIAGGDVVIQNTVQGDVVAAGGRVEIAGDVTGDVIAAGGEVVIKGDVDDDVRIAGGTLRIEGNIGDDLIAAGGDLIVSSNTKIEGDMVYSASQVRMLGELNGDMKGGADTITLDGNVGGNVDVEVNNLEILSGTHIGGNLNYTSTSEAEISSGTVGGDINFVEESTGTAEGFGFLSVIWWIIKYLALLIVGMVALKLWPSGSMSILENIETNPLKNLGIGFVLIIAGLVGSIILLMTIVGIPLGIVLLFIIGFSLYAARLYTGLWIGKYLSSKIGKSSSRPSIMLAAGLFLLMILSSIPWVGIVVYLLATLVAIGAVYYESKRHYEELKDKNMI
ncbi:hypothetical protein [Methanohalobium sp.]|uniref:hypothetical protein n=1 Tax=Methanohalobium sp. TaxID=2837493 RepID=UPI0025F6ADEA|nr:hypothetical protein [Methanohalobium sp.]